MVWKSISTRDQYTKPKYETSYSILGSACGLIYTN